MAQLLGKVKSMRVINGEYKSGKRQGEQWEFLSIEIIDEDSGAVWSCQMPSDDEQYAEVTQRGSLVHHKVNVMVMGQTASERELPDKRKVMQIRSQITGLQDEGTAVRSGRVA